MIKKGLKTLNLYRNIKLILTNKAQNFNRFPMTSMTMLVFSESLWFAQHLMGYIDVHGPDRFWRHYGQNQNQGYFQGVCCRTADHHFYINIATLQTIAFTCNIATPQTIFLHNLWCCIHTVNFLKIILILQPARSDMKIGPASAHVSARASWQVRLLRTWARHVTGLPLLLSG